MTDPQMISPRDDDPFHTGDRIHKAWQLAGYEDATSFASAVGIDRGALRRYEKTGKVPRRSTLIAIAWHTPVRLEWLETGKGPVFKEDGPDGGYPRWGSNPRPATYRFGGFGTVVDLAPARARRRISAALA